MTLVECLCSTADKRVCRPEHEACPDCGSRRSRYTLIVERAEALRVAHALREDAIADTNEISRLRAKLKARNRQACLFARRMREAVAGSRRLRGERDRLLEWARDNGETHHSGYAYCAGCGCGLDPQVVPHKSDCQWVALVGREWAEANGHRVAE